MTTYDRRELAQTTIRIPLAQHRRIADAAARAGTSIGAMIRASIDCGLDEAEKMPLASLEAYEPKKARERVVRQARAKQARKVLRDLGLGGG